MSFNLGVGRALNNRMAYALSRSRQVGRIDNDILVPKFWLRDLLRVMNSSPTLGIVGPKINPLGDQLRFTENVEPRLVEGLHVYDVPCLGGACNLYARHIFSDLGFYPETPLFGVEDGGQCAAVQKAGLGMLMIEDVQVEHLSYELGDEKSYRALKDEQCAIFNTGQAFE